MTRHRSIGFLNSPWSLTLIGLFFALLAIAMDLAPTFRDWMQQVLPYRAIAREALYTGTLPFWANEPFGGSPFLANLQTQILYPPALLSYLGPERFTLPLLIAFHGFVLGSGIWCLARRLKASQAGSFIAAASSVFGSPGLALQDTFPAHCSLAWIPWVLNLALQLREERRGKIAVRLALVLSLCILAGEPLYAGLAVLLVLLLLGATQVAESKRPVLTQTSLLLGGAFVLTGCLTAVQIFPFLRELGESTRATGLPAKEVLLWSLHPYELLQLILPTFAGGLWMKWIGQEWLRGFYLGAIGFLLALFAPRSRRSTRFLWATSAGFLVLAMIGNLPGLRLLAVHLPGFTWNRYPSKFAPFALLALSLLAASGYDLLSGTSKTADRARRTFVITLGSLVALQTIYLALQQSFMTWFLSYSPEATFPRPASVWLREMKIYAVLPTLAPLLLCGLVFWSYVFTNGRQRTNRWVPLIPSFLLLELLLVSPAFLHWAPRSALEAGVSGSSRMTGITEGAAANAGRFLGPRIYCRPPKAADTAPWLTTKDVVRRSLLQAAALCPNWGIAAGIQLAYGYQGLTPRMAKEFQLALEDRLQAEPSSAEEEALRFLLEEGQVTHTVSWRSPTSSGTESNSEVLPILVKPTGVSRMFCRSGPQFSSAKPIACAVDSDQPGHFTIRILEDMPENHLLFLPFSHHANWRALAADGSALALQPAGTYARATAISGVTSAQSVLTLDYREFAWPWGYLATAFLWILLSFCAFADCGHCKGVFRAL